MSAPHPPASPFSRRRFLKATALAAGSIGSGCLPLQPTAAPGDILDTHTHFYDPRRPGGVPWPPPENRELHRPVLPAEYETLARPLGIRGTVIVEASPLIPDNDWILALLQQNPFLTGFIGHLRPADDSFPNDWRRLSRDPAFRGIRTGGWDGPVDIRRPKFIPHCRLIAEQGRILEVLIGPELLPDIARLAEAVPHLPMVIDHCANLRIDGQQPPAEWLRGMDACARHPHIHVKFSGLVEGSGRTRGDAPDDVNFYRPVLDALWERFGSQRLIFGSNWPVSTLFAPLDRVVRIARSYLDSRGRDASIRCLRTNAQHLYRV